MKKIISIILALALCLSCCFALAACKDDSDKNREKSINDKYDEYRRETEAEIAKTYFSALTDTYNALIVIEGNGISINEDTTIQEVMDFLEAEGRPVVIEHLNTSLAFLDGCYEEDSGTYSLRTDIDWHDFYIE